MRKGLVSICVPTFNGADYIKESLGSAIEQDYSDIEITVSDDNSSDNTLDIVNEIKKKSIIPIHIHQHKPSGIGANWNHCVEKANGEYIKFLFQDDILEPNCISELMNVAKKDNKLGLVFCKRKIIFDKSDKGQLAWVKQYQDVHAHWASLKEIQPGKDLLKDENLLNEPQNKVGEPSCVLLKKEVFDKVGYFNTILKQALDLEFWFRVFTRYKVGFVNQELVSFRLHDMQASAMNLKENIVDHALYPELLYKNCRSYLHEEVRRELFYRTTSMGKSLAKISRKFKHNL